MKKLVYALIFIISSAFILASCNMGAGKKVKLEVAVWGSVKEVEIIKKTIKAFNEKHPDVEVIISQSPQGQGYIDKLLTRAASSSMPDLLFCEVNFVDKFIEKNMLLDIAPFLKKDQDLKEKDFFPEIINRFKRENRIYGLPRDVAPFACIFYNKDLFDVAGLAYPKDNWNIMQFLNAAKKLTKRDRNGSITQYGFYAWSWQNFVYTFGGRLVDDVRNPKKCLLDQKEAVEGIQFYKDLIYKYKVVPTPASREMGFVQMFMTGKLAMYGSGIWETPSFRDIKNFKWDVAMFPKGPKGTRGFATGGSGYAVSSMTKSPELAWELLKFMSGELSQIELARTGLAQPALKKLAYGPYWGGDRMNPPAHKEMLNDAVKYTIFNPFISRWSEIEQKVISPKIELIERDQLDVKKALNEVTREVDEELKK